MKIIFDILFFLYFSCLGIYGPYLAVYLVEKGFSGVQTGLLLGSMPIAILIASPIWSYISDVLNKRKVLLLIGCVGAGLSSLALRWADQYAFNFLWVILMAIMSAPILPTERRLSQKPLKARWAASLQPGAPVGFLGIRRDQPGLGKFFP